MWSQIDLQSFRPPSTDPGRFSNFFLLKNVILCDVPIYTWKRIFQKLHLKIWSHELHAFQNSYLFFQNVLTPKYSERLPTVSIIDCMISECRQIFFRLTSMGQSLHCPSSAFCDIIIFHRLFRFLCRRSKSSCDAKKKSTEFCPKKNPDLVV